MSRRLMLQLIIGVMWLFLVAVATVSLLAVRWYNSNLQPVDRQQTSKQRFEVARGANLDEIAANLESQGLIRDATAFKWHALFNGLDANLQAGAFELSPSDYASEIAEILNSATLANLYVTIYPNQRLDQIEDSLVEQGFKRLDVQVAMQASKYANHPVSDYKPPDASLEGYLAPETFAVNQFNADSAESVIRRSLDVFADNLTEEIKIGILENEAVFQDIHEGVILASIVEAEVSLDDPGDRPKVAQVFIKRLKTGTKLESDVTFIYAAAVEGGEPGVDYPSPYNTRLHGGLPPGPIGNVSVSSLRAVAFPADTDYLFFVTGDDGITHFNETLEGHVADVRRYCLEGCGAH
ncbi:endolytic transglycosylase MltG [Candidatus Saccharibacteria bacterium]|nr:endolytic transglycosylase MltG [Candidatus Saccharibacteria bacterium]